MRARNIKPGFFINPEMADCSIGARLLFAGLWCLADREGLLLDRPRHIKGELFRYDEVDLRPWLEELATKGFIERYSADGLDIISIPTFHLHQRPHYNEKPSTLPKKPGLATKVASEHNQGNNHFALNEDRGMRNEESGSKVASASAPFDLDTLLLQEWGKKGHVGYGNKTRMVELARAHGWDRLKYAIEEAAKHNAMSPAYVEKIMLNAGKGKPSEVSIYRRDPNAPRPGKVSA
jgi:hypothetical protein